MNAPTNAAASGAPTLAWPDGQNVVLLLGAPRSGTTWLAKIFDSHPRVLYRHEPDTVLRNDRIPFLCPRDQAGAYRDEARRYLTQLLDVRTLKSAGSLPLFRKDYYGQISWSLRAGVVYSLHAADTMARGSRWARRFPIPDLVSHSADMHPVIKSVGSRGRALVWAQALPKSRIVFIMRHPCGQVASTLRGMKSGKFEHNETFRAVLVTEEAQTLGLTMARFSTFSPLEQCAWHWAIMNQKTLNDLSTLDGNRFKVVRYEDACTDPEGVSKELLAFSGLDWNEQTAAFVAKSTTGGDTNEFYGTSRNSLAAANKWRTTLSAEDQRRIRDIATRVPAGEMFASMA